MLSRNDVMLPSNQNEVYNENESKTLPRVPCKTALVPPKVNTLVDVFIPQTGVPQK